jgi:hypothetical protein
MSVERDVLDYRGQIFRLKARAAGLKLYGIFMPLPDDFIPILCGSDYINHQANITLPLVCLRQAAQRRFING